MTSGQVIASGTEGPRELDLQRQMAVIQSDRISPKTFVTFTLEDPRWCVR